MKPKWVRGKALQTVIGLKEIRVGDEIVIGKCRKDREHNLLADRPCYRKVLRVVEVTDNVPFPIAFQDLKNQVEYDRLCCLCSIKAWRRPT